MIPDGLREIFRTLKETVSPASDLGSLASALPKASSLPSFRSLAKFALGSLQIGLGPSGRRASVAPACSNPQLSCRNTTAVVDTCCFNAPGGQLLLTQFWDASPATGPSDSWTIHGLWPDHCDGTYDASCDPNRQYSNISEIIQHYGRQDLLDFMDKYWKDYQGCDASLWEHEWNKHGTCISTLSPSCYSDYVPQEEVVDFFYRAVQLFKGLDTYQILAAAGVVPSTSNVYTSQQIQDVISAATGHTVTIGCRHGHFNEVWYHFNVRGSVRSGEFVATEPDGTKSTCPATGIRYPPKSGPPPACSRRPPVRTPTATPTTSHPAPSGTGTPFSGKGFLNVETGGSLHGCIISNGKWYSTGTCATFTATTSGSNFTLSSRKGKCAITNDALTCNPTISAATIFSESNGYLTTDGNSAFYANAVAKRWTQQTVYTIPEHPTVLKISWQEA
ncbi:hypothetical protein FGG08_005711 [Glutinoglossum americanum]|uniref:Ribonuclease T2-like n=1 Tax=Glutinoglossum americanum TaxID=1670608 RepID=A0A9P8L1K7_9PEZI|nr:hypothetical protein FGG08_005711 [Glutinoglossum americanum]